MRCAAIDASTGRAANLYPLLHAATNPTAPTSPWAVNLTNRDGDYRLLAFDLDAKTDDSAAATDAALLGELLASVKIPHLTCASGPSGGRHLWIGLRESVPPIFIARLARVLRQLAPTLDLSPLLNPATGSVRPPGAPHRHGGTSRVLHGTLDVLLAPSTTQASLQRLLLAATARAQDALRVSTSSEPPALARAAASLPAHAAAEGIGPHRRIALDATGHPYLPGPAQPLPRASHHVLRHGKTQSDPEVGNATPSEGRKPAVVPRQRDHGIPQGSRHGSPAPPPPEPTDASTNLWHVLVGAARSHWHLSQLSALLDQPGTPGLEHARTRRSPTPLQARVPRPRRGQDSPRAVLARQWARAVRWVAANPRSAAAAEPDDFPERAGAITDLAQSIQTRADAMPGRWSKGSGPADRRVLDGLCVLALQGITTHVEADIRRLGLLVGIGRETARTSLLRLADQGWLTRAATATGVRGAIWELLDPGHGGLDQGPAAVIHRDSDLVGHKRSRAPRQPSPRPTGPLERAGTLHALQQRLAAGTHDAFTPGSLGLAAGNVVARIRLEAAPDPGVSDYVDELLAQLDPGLVDRLADFGLLGGRHKPGLRSHVGQGSSEPRTGVAARPEAVLDAVSVADGTYGRLVARAATVAVERELWAWWCAEIEWMRASRPAQRARPGTGQEPLWGPRIQPGEHHHRRHPRCPSGRADYPAARAQLAAA